MNCEKKPEKLWEFRRGEMHVAWNFTQLRFGCVTGTGYVPVKKAGPAKSLKTPSGHTVLKLKPTFPHHLADTRTPVL